MPAMEKVKRLLGEKITVLKEFNIKKNQHKKELDGPRDQWSTKILVE